MNTLDFLKDPAIRYKSYPHLMDEEWGLGEGKSLAGSHVAGKWQRIA